MTEQQPKLSFTSEYIGGEAVGFEAIIALVVMVVIICATRLALRSRK